MFQGYRIYGLHFDPLNRINLAFESLRVKKTLFMHIMITGSPIPIPFLPKTFFICVGGVRNYLRISDRRFAF